MIDTLARAGRLALIVCGLAAPAWAQGYDAGMAAYEAGDYERAARIWEPLARGGDATAQYSLGKLYETGGMDLPKDDRRAVEWYRLSAAQGISAAQNNLGLMYAQGRGAARDPARAVELWTLAARQDHSMAQFNLALAYFRGEGVAENKVEAERWFRRAAGLGLADAQYALGQIKLLGLNSQVDKGEALNWYQLAAAQGHAKAREQAELLRREGVKPRLAQTLSGAAEDAGGALEAGEAGAGKDQEKPTLPPPPAPAQPASGPAAARKPALPEAPVIDKPAAAAPKAEPAPTQVARQPQPQAAEKELAGSGGVHGGTFRVWFRSEKSEAAAAGAVREIRRKHPNVFAGRRIVVAPADLGQGGVFYRVVAEGLPTAAAARALCQQLRGMDPAAFCKVLPGQTHN
ncbi:MAG: tetratricopeptide repeat protein [Kiloniellaceae bacterium]